MKFVPVPGKTVLFSIWPTRVQDYAAYAKAQEAAGKKVDGSWKTQSRDGVPVGRETDHPVTGVSWEDAQAFCQWLTAKEAAEGKLPQGMKYRLPSDEEWSCAVGLPLEVGATPAEKSGKNNVDFPWGKDWPLTRKLGNYGDETFHAKFPKHWKDKEQDQPWIKGYTDGYATTSPVGSFPANAYGLYDMGGNVWQWCEDWFDKDQKDRVLRGASWDLNDRGLLHSSHRSLHPPGFRVSTGGFRCVLEPRPSATAISPSPNLPVSKSSATKFPPGQWVKLFTKPEDLPADLRKPDSGVKWEDGWIRVTPTTKPIVLPDELRGNYGVRFRAIRANILTDMALRWQRSSNVAEKGLYSVGLNGDQLMLRRMEGGKYFPIRSGHLVESPGVGSEYFQEFGIVGNRLVGRVGSNPPEVARDSHWHQGPGYLSATEDIRDIEVMNLNGLPEAEALRLLGVDEQGNDLRGKTGAAEAWIDVLRDPSIVTLTQGAEITPEGLRLPAQSGAYVARSKSVSGDVAMRVRTTFGGPRLQLRVRGGGARGFYSLTVVDDKTVSMQRFDLATNQGISLRDFTLTSPLKPGEDYEMEFRCVGPALTASLNGEVLGTVMDGTHKEGGCSLSAWEASQTTALAKAFYILDLSKSSASAVSPAPNLPVSKASPAPETWQDALKDRTFSQSDGKCSIGPDGFRSHIDYIWRLLDGPLRDGAVRMVANYEGPQSPKLIARSDAGSKNHYQVNFEPGGGIISLVRKADTAYFNLAKAPLASPLRTGDPVELELRAIGSELTVSLNGNLLLRSSDTTLPEGRFGIWATAKAQSPVRSLQFLPLASSTAAVSPSPSPQVSPSPSAATKDAPFVNTLGMKFVPVPITGGPTDKQRVLFSIWETRVQDYEAFLKETKREWGKAPFEQGPTHPVVGPNWDDAQAFCDWLTETERKAGKLGANERYRLPSDHEWSCAVDLGDKEDASKLPVEKHLKIADVFPWGTQWPPPKGTGNFAGEEMQPALAAGKFSNIKGEMSGYHDGFVDTSPVGSFAANRFGLHDMGGNVWQWCADWVDGSQKARVLRGSSSQDRDRILLQSSFRNRYQPQAHMINHGFRVVLAQQP